MRDVSVEGGRRVGTNKGEKGQRDETLLWAAWNRRKRPETVELKKKKSVEEH